MNANTMGMRDNWGMWEKEAGYPIEKGGNKMFPYHTTKEIALSVINQLTPSQANNVLEDLEIDKSAFPKEWTSITILYKILKERM